MQAQPNIITSRKDRIPKIGLGQFSLILLSSLAIGLNIFGESRDRANYRYLFETLSQRSLNAIFSGVDFCFAAMVKIASIAGISFDAFMVIVSFMSLYLLAQAIKDQPFNRLLFMVLWASLLLWIQNYTQVRLALATSIFLFAIYRMKRFGWLLSIAAIAIHSAMLLPVLVWFGAKRYSIRVTVILVVIGAILLLIINANFESALRLYNSISAESAAKVYEYIKLRNAGTFADQDMFALMPMIQLATTIYVLLFLCLTKPRGTSEVAMALVGPICFYTLNVLPVLAIRAYEMFIPFYLIFITKYIPRSRLLQFVMFVYVLLGLKSAFFGALPIVPFFDQ